jgi:hypothetical protein
MPKGVTFHVSPEIIGLRQYDAEFINQMGSLASNISIANMPHARANQILTPSIPFRMGTRAHSHQRARPWNLGLVRTRAEARGWTINQLLCEVVRESPLSLSCKSPV